MDSLPAKRGNASGGALVGGALFLIAQMSQNSIDDVLVLDTRDDSDGSTAAAADFDVYAAYSLESLSPGHGGMALSR